MNRAMCAWRRRHVACTVLGMRLRHELAIALFTLPLLIGGCDAQDAASDPKAEPVRSADEGATDDETKTKREKPGRREKRGKPTKPARQKPTGKDKQKKGPQPNPNAKPDDGSTYTIKLRFHLLKSDEAEIVNTTIDEAGVQRLVDDVNAVWKQANIRFELESVVKADAVNAAAYQTLADEWKKSNKAKRKSFKGKKGKLMRATTPEGNRIDQGIDIYMHRYMLGLGGVWGCPHRSIVYAERKSFKSDTMASGTILAHEIGHSLGLPHVPCKKGGNLMMEPCKHRQPDAFELTKDQLAAARSWAQTGGPRPCRKGETDTED